MKKISVLAAAFGFAAFGAASAADITVYYSPSCPHCHHARDFIGETLIYEYPQIRVTEINVMEDENLSAFQDVVAKCEYTSGGVPVMVIGEKCFQGYADYMQDDIRAAVEADMTDADKQVAAENKAKLEQDPEGFKAANADRANAVVDMGDKSADATDNHGGKSAILFGGLAVVLIAALGFVLVKRKRQNKRD